MTEGDTNIVLSCSASSKPVSSFTWYHGSNKIDESGSQQPSNQYSYTISSVQRTHYGTYKCLADNGVNPNDEDSIDLNVLCKIVVP